MTTLKIYFVPDIFDWNSPKVPVHLLTMNTVSGMRGKNQDILKNTLGDFNTNLFLFFTGFG